MKFAQSVRYIIFVATFVWTVLISAHPKPAHRITVKLSGISDTTLYLANYFGKNVYKVDSARVDGTGMAIFEGEKPLGQGIYLVYLDGNNFFEFLVGSDQTFDIEAHFSEPVKNKFSGAEESVTFHQYQSFLASQRDRQLKLQQALTNHSAIADSVKAIGARLSALNDEMEQYWETQSQKFKGQFLGDFFRSMLLPRQPLFEPSERDKNPDSLRWANRYHFIRNHFWDNFNFTQPGFVRTPLIDEKLETYFKRSLLQIPDSMIHPAIEVAGRAKVNPEMYQYILLYLLNMSNQSEIMGMESLFVSLAKKYVLTGEASFLDSVSQSKIANKVRLTEPNMIGRIAPDLKLPDSEGNYYSLRQMNGPITLLYFWEPNCSHCQKTTPELFKDLYIPLRNKGVEVFAVCTQPNRDEWMEAIQKYGIHEWTNVWDPLNSSNFRHLYDISTTPVLYILDAHKKIIAKRIDVPTAFKFIQQYLGQQH